MAGTKHTIDRFHFNHLTYLYNSIIIILSFFCMYKVSIFGILIEDKLALGYNERSFTND
ncbi:hypothetical protein EfmGK961_17160 [Enterococcus faecium]|nr:hypothetical protein EfmGK961_17160 [Enterococcus faecium]